VDGRTTRHEGYKISQQKRKRVEEIFGWMKTVGGLRKLRHRGLESVGWMFTFTAAAYNLMRIRNLSTSVARGKCMRRSVSKSAWEGAKSLQMPAKCLENATQGTTHCSVGVFLTLI
jgi:hypothetical protein